MIGSNITTGEFNTGKKWIDGKDIYRKVIEIPSLPNNSEGTYPLGINNIDTIVRSDIMVNKTTVAFNVPYVHDQAPYSIQCYFHKSAGTIRIKTFSDRSDYPAHVIIEYTKN